MIWFALLILPLGLYVFDRLARRNSWRIGKLSWPLPPRSVIIVRGEVVPVIGICAECRTTWRYVLPHVTIIRRDGKDRVIYVICEKCYRGMPLDNVLRVYGHWWVEKVRRMQEQGELHDPGEFDDIRAALRVGG